MEWMGKVSACPAFGGGGVSDFAELRAGFWLHSTNAPDLRAGAGGRHFPLHGISIRSFLIDLRDSSVEAALPLLLSRTGRDGPFSLFTPLKI